MRYDVLLTVEVDSLVEGRGDEVLGEVGGGSVVVEVLVVLVVVATVVVVVDFVGIEILFVVSRTKLVEGLSSLSSSTLLKSFLNFYDMKENYVKKSKLREENFVWLLAYDKGDV